MEHYQHLIYKALINRGGSSSETYVYQLLTGDVGSGSTSIADMWGYLDVSLQQELAVIFSEICRVDIGGDDPISQIKEYVAQKSGRREFFEHYTREQIDRMSDDEYENGIESLIDAKRKKLSNR